MEVRDKELKKKVDVREKSCPKKSCYWPRPFPGLFTQGQGYKQLDSMKGKYVCGTREARGCPVEDQNAKS